MAYDKIIIHSDGGARNNPGPAGIGAVLKDEAGEMIASISKYIGETTNNQAEYEAVIAAMEKAKELGAKELEMNMDSELVCQQLNGKYKVKNEGLAPLFVRVWNLKLNFKKVAFKHVRREFNKEADALVNMAIDKALKK